MSHLERASFHINIYFSYFLINARSFIHSTTYESLRVSDTTLHPYNVIGNVETLSPCFPFYLPRFHHPSPLPIPPPPPQTTSPFLSLSLPPSLSFPRFRIRIANETSNYHQRLPRGGPSGKIPLSLSLSLSHFFLLTFAISSRKQHRQVAPAFLFCHVVGHGNKPNLYLANRSLFFFPPSFFLSFQAIRASKPREPRLIRRYEEV